MLSKMPHPSPTEKGCWLWPGAVFTNGYGHIRWRGRSVKAHRLAFIAVHGPVPEGLGVLHKCNNKLCYNPEHLYAGTPQDNADDAVAAGVIARRPGELCPTAKLTNEKVLEILRRLALGHMHAEIARAFSVSVTTITNISGNKIWKNIPRERNPKRPHWATKLTEDMATEIVRRLSIGHSCYAIAKDFPVHRVTIADIRDNKTWKNILRY